MQACMHACTNTEREGGGRKENIEDVITYDLHNFRQDCLYLVNG